MAKAVEKQMVFTAKIVEEMTDKLNDGVILKRYENPWYKSEVGIRRAGVSYAFNDNEIEEYIKCSQDIHYFVEKYCKVKTEDGSIGSIKLRDYQKEILDNFRDNRFSILMASRQVGKCLVYNTLCEVSLNDNEYVFNVRLGDLYYHYLSKIRKLTFIERLKMNLYDIVFLLEGGYIIKNI